jgi:predicted transposase YbfD/YdcC
LALLASVPDPRARRGVRHQLPAILAVGLAAVLAGARSFVAIGEWVAHQSTQTLTQLGVTGVAPGESTIRRAFTRLEADTLDALLGAHLWTRTAVIGGRRVIAIDGKTVRGARNKSSSAPHLVSAFDHHAGAVLGQVAVAAKSNEIPAVQGLLDLFELAGAVVTVDAMHTQTDTAAAITAAGGDYVFTVKANQPRLHAACKNLPWAKVPAHSTLSRRHGRRARRTIKVLQAPAWVDFPGATQIAQVRRTVTRAGKKSVEVVYLITSADHQAAPPATLAAWVQGHWGIENQLHWVRDVTYDEDRSQIRTGNAPQVMATLRNTAISLLRLTGWTNIAAGLRHHARDPQGAVKLLLTC